VDRSATLRGRSDLRIPKPDHRLSGPPAPAPGVDQIRIPIIREAGGKLTQNPDPFLDLPQEQPTAVAGDRSAVELRPDLTSLLGMKSEDKLVTLCGHKAVAPSWQNLSRQKSYAMKPQPFSIYCEKFPLEVMLSSITLPYGTIARVFPLVLFVFAPFSQRKNVFCISS
jgi:hypothetical protein